MRVLTLSFFAAILSAPAFAADLGTYRPGASYHSVIAPGADVCDNQCAGDAQCRGWNYVKTNPRAPGICEFLSSVSAPIASQISISGVNLSATPFSSRVTTGGTNTVRVGTQASPRTNRVAVGQSPSGRRIVRQAPTQRIAPQQASTKPVENMSLTEQQNRYRQGGTAAAPIQAPHQPHAQASAQPRFPQAAPQRPVFRQHLDAASQQAAALQQQQLRFQQQQQQQLQQQRQLQQQQFQQPQTREQQVRQPRREASRRVTGPRRAPTQANVQNRGATVPQYQTPQYQAPQPQGQPFPPQPVQQQGPQQQFQAPQSQGAPIAQSGAPQPVLRRGSSRPPVGQPVPTAQAPQSQAPVPQRRRRSTPSERLAEFAAQTPAAPSLAPSDGAIALTPEQARKSLFGSLNDDVRSPEDTPADMPIATSVPSGVVTQQALGDVLAGGL